MKTFKQYQIQLSWKFRRFGTTLKQKLTNEGRTRWLDIGCGDKFEDGFCYLDWYPSNKMPPGLAERFYQASIVELRDADFEALGQFDLVRMQHVLEHFSFEEGLTVLNSCGRLLAPDGILLLTVPDLKIYVRSYLRNRYNNLFRGFARDRVPWDAPSSCYFSVFAHSYGYSPTNSEHKKFRDQHKWCYDYEGIAYQLSRTGEFKNIRELSLFSPLAHIPFTHSRPEEDLCVVAQRA